MRPSFNVRFVISPFHNTRFDVTIAEYAVESYVVIQPLLVRARLGWMLPRVSLIGLPPALSDADI